MRQLGRYQALSNQLVAIALFGVLSLVSLLASGDTETPLVDTYHWQLPSGFPLPRSPANNPMSDAKVELGRHLFYDTLLSSNNTYSCASCHQQQLAFTDGLKNAVGLHNHQLKRNTMSLTNVAYNAYFTWASHETISLEQQALIPLFNQNPPELGFQDENELIAVLNQQAFYQSLLKQAFGANTWQITHVTSALSAFQRTLISGDSAYDRFVFFDDDSAFSESAKRGMALFYSERLKCGQCHGGFNFAAKSFLQQSSKRDNVFHNTGLFEHYPVTDQGLFTETNLISDEGKYKAPTLRNIAVTAPYMHDGSIDSLADVLQHYARGGRLIPAGANAGDGAKHSNKDKTLTGFKLSSVETQDLLTFLNALTDQTFLANPRFANPFLD